MTPVIHQRVRFRTSPQALFNPYLDSRKHSFSTGASANASRKAGGKSKHLAASLKAEIYCLWQIVQLWRASHSEERRLVHLDFNVQSRRGRSTSRSRASRCPSVRSQRSPQRLAAVLVAAVEKLSRNILFERERKTINRATISHPPPTNCTISSLSPFATGVSSHFALGRICKLYSIATRPACIPSWSSRPRTVVPACVSRLSPFT